MIKFIAFIGGNVGAFVIGIGTRSGSYTVMSVGVIIAIISTIVLFRDDEQSEVK